MDSVSFLPFPLRKLPDAFVLTDTKSWYAHDFDTEENLDYVGSKPDVSYYGLNELGEKLKWEFLTWYESEKSEKPFNKRRVLQRNSQDDVSHLRSACRVFRREFMR